MCFFPVISYIMQSNVSLQIDHVVKMQGELFQHQDDKFQIKQTNKQTKNTLFEGVEITFECIPDPMT